MLSVIIPTLNAEETLTRTLAPLVPGAVRGLVQEVIVVDGGSSDETLEIVEAAGAKLVRAPKGRGPQLAAGAKAAKGNWLLFLHADTVLEPGWIAEVEKFFEQIEAGRFRDGEMAASFRFALDDFSGWARIIETRSKLQADKSWDKVVEESDKARAYEKALVEGEVESEDASPAASRFVATLLSPALKAAAAQRARADGGIRKEYAKLQQSAGADAAERWLTAALLAELESEASKLEPAPAKADASPSKSTSMLVCSTSASMWTSTSKSTSMSM